MAARWAVPDRIHRPTGLKGLAEFSGPNPCVRPRICAPTPHDIERYLGNGYLAAVARGLSHRGAAAGARRAGNADEVAGEARGPASTPSATVQAKLVVGAAGDAFEREADRVADLLIRRAGARALGGRARPGAAASQRSAGAGFAANHPRGDERHRRAS